MAKSEKSYWNRGLKIWKCDFFDLSYLISLLWKIQWPNQTNPTGIKSYFTATILVTLLTYKSNALIAPYALNRNQLKDLNHIFDQIIHSVSDTVYITEQSISRPWEPFCLHVNTILNLIMNKVWSKFLCGFRRSQLFLWYFHGVHWKLSSFLETTSTLPWFLLSFPQLRAYLQIRTIEILISKFRHTFWIQSISNTWKIFVKDFENPYQRFMSKSKLRTPKNLWKTCLDWIKSNQFYKNV